MEKRWWSRLKSMKWGTDRISMDAREPGAEEKVLVAYVIDSGFEKPLMRWNATLQLKLLAERKARSFKMGTVIDTKTGKTVGLELSWEKPTKDDVVA